MTIEVVTETTCDVCGNVEKVKGSEGLSPAKWFRVTLNVRLPEKTRQWGESLFTAEVFATCPPCGQKVKDLLGVK